MRVLLASAIALFLGAAALAETPYGAGFVVIDVPGDPPDPGFPAAVWYPTHAAESTWQAGSYEITAARDAAPAPGRFPLVVISHGSGGIEYGHRDWADYLARHGFVVVAPRHVGDSVDHPEGRGSDVQLTGRLWQVKEAIDAVLADPRLGPAIDPDRIGMVGFSAGGYTTLATIGGRPDYSLWNDYCQAHRDDEEMCYPDGRTVPRITRPGWELPPPDDRIKAAAVMAPLGLVFDKAALADISVPIHLYRAAEDQHARNAWNADHVAADLPAPPEEIITVPGGHFIFLAPCPEALAAELPVVCTDPPGIDRAAIHAEIAGELVEFFDRTLRQQ